MKLPNYAQFPKDRPVYFLASGGKDSTAMILQAYKEGIKGTLVYGDTRLNSGLSKKVIGAISDHTGYPVVVCRYNGDKRPIDVLKDAFRRIPKCIEKKKETGTFRRNMFQCCRILKHKPMQEYLHQQEENRIVVMGIRGYGESIHRIGHMNKLRKRNSFLHEHVELRSTVYYPLRDLQQCDIDATLGIYGWSNVRSTGCGICPIFMVFEKWRMKDPKSFRRSLILAKRLKIKCEATMQSELSDYDCGTGTLQEKSK